MNVFEKHGITHLSASSLRLYREEPAAWCVKYLLRIKDESGPGAWRGTAVEAGLDRLLFGYDKDMAIASMRAKWDELAQGVVDDKAAKEYEALEDFLAQAQRAVSNRPVPLTKQSKISIDIPGIEIPLIGYVDYRWEDCGLDLKTTMRMPSEAKPDHVEQMAIYSKATGLPFSLLYVTPKKFSIHEVTEAMAAEALERVYRGARAIRHMLSKVESATDALRLYSPAMDSWNWSPPMIEAAQAVYAGAAA
jgi:hypothetical protein